MDSSDSDEIQQKALVNMVMNLKSPLKEGSFLTS
jgi:hypothetical protein